MSGHSKWANIKHKKAKEDARRGKAFTKLSRQITVAAREGGADPEMNFRLRLAIDSAKAVNMPNDNIQRAIDRGTGGLDGDDYEEFSYEGYGSGGVAVLLNIMTDNRNRTAADMRHLFAKHGGNLGESGCVAWMFDKKGLLAIDGSEHPVDEDELMLAAIEAGAEDVEIDDDSVGIITDPEEFESAKRSLEADGYHFDSAEIIMRPQTLVHLDGAEAEKVLKLVDALEDHDDVQAVFTNLDVDDEVLAAYDS